MRTWKKCVLTIVLGLAISGVVVAGTGYEVKSQGKDGEVTYMVNFGGGFNFEQYTAFDPASKKFVYLTWKREQPKPEPAATIWDHRTGETIHLFKFPGVDKPLPVIPSIEAMKVCPMTGDKAFKAKPLLAYD